MTYDNTNKGFLRKNENRETLAHPEYRGEITITEPGTYWLSGWINEHEKMGGKYFSLRAKKKDFTKAKEAARSVPDPGAPLDHDESPF